MPKTTRLGGASKADGTQAPVVRRLGGEDVELVGANADHTIGGQLEVRGATTLRGQILTSTAGQPTPSRFGGIEGEGMSIDAGSMASDNQAGGELAMSFAGGTPRLVMPDGVRSDAYVVRGLPNWWLDRGLTIGFDWTNDHTATGNVRWQFELRENNTATQLSAADVPHTSTVTLASPPANGAYLTNVVGINIPLSPSFFGSLYSLRMTRLGADGADALLGPIGLLEVVLARGSL